MSKERLTDYIEKQKICDYIQGWINPYGKPFDGTVYEFGLKIMDYIKNSSCDEDAKELKQYRDLEEQGLLLRLPCERVWFICDKGSKYATVMSKSIYDLEVYQIKEIDVKGHYFSTEEKAEEKLRELGKS